MVRNEFRPGPFAALPSSAIDPRFCKQFCLQILLRDGQCGELFVCGPSPETDLAANADQTIFTMDPVQFDRVLGRESVAPRDGPVRVTGRSPAVQVPEDPFGCLLAGDRPVLLPHPEDGSLGEWGGERGGGVMNIVHIL